MGQTSDPAMDEARGYASLSPKERPSSLKSFLDALHAKKVIGGKDPEDESYPDGVFFGERLSRADLMTGCAYYVQAVMGMVCDHPTYGLRKLAKPVRDKVIEIGDGIKRLSVGLFDLKYTAGSPTL